MTLAVTRLQRGDIIDHRDSKVWLLAPCDLVNVAYYCATCDAELPSRGHLGVHVKEPPKTGETHAIARWCPKHGFEAPHDQPEKPESSE